MADAAALQKALLSARKDGDVEALRRIAGMLEQMEQQPQQEPAANRFSQGAISAGANTLDFLLRPAPGMAELPMQEPLIGSAPNLLQGAENLGITQPGALERTDPLSVAGRAVSGIPFGAGAAGIGGANLIRALGMEMGAAAGSAGGELIGQEVAGEIGGTIGAIAGGFFMPASKPAPASAQQAANSQRAILMQMADESARTGLPIQLADVNPSLRRMQGWLEATPLTGAVGRRAQRLDDTRSAAERLASDAQKRLAQLKWDNISQVQRAARGSGGRAQEAKRLLETIQATTEDDLDRIIGVSQRLELFKSKLTSDELYGRASRLSRGIAGTPRNAEASAIRAARQLARGANADMDSANAMQRLAGELSARSSIEEMRISRSNILEAARDHTNLQAKAGLESIADALHQDMEQVALASGAPEAYTAIRAANKHYRTQVVRRRNAALSKALDKTDLAGSDGQRFVEDVVRQYLNPRRTEQAMFTWRQLGAKGRAAVEARIFSDAFEKASLRSDIGTAVFSPRQFAKALEDYGTFPAQIGQTRIQGLSKLFRTVARDSAPGASPFTGGRAADQLPAVGLGYAFAAAPVLAATGWFSARGLQAVMESPAGRALITQAARAPRQRDLLQISARLTAIAGREQENERGAK